MSLVKKVETQSGSTYLIDEERGFWKKNNDSWERIWWAYSVPASIGSFKAAYETEEKLSLTVGFRMYIGSREVWWLTSVIESITEVELS